MKKQIIYSVFLAAIFGFPGVVSADVEVHAVFDGQAVISVDGERALVNEGEAGPGGLRLLQTGSGRVQVEHEGETLWLERGGAAGSRTAGGSRSGEESASGPGVSVHPDSRGRLTATVGVNGRAITMEVDREAESVMLRERDAERAGVDADAGSTVHLRTDRGRVDARRVTLDEVRVGSIRRSGVSAVIVPDDHIPRAVMGQTFLDRVEVESSGDALILR
ncbi:TIGR02281 family clan AA aspartic protease [Thioalkalivibrio sp. ALJ24]|uniref:retropepsin-like aspartic protease family protein n=1 Tax=Thioalkalivibrio sp. ALJ24 TaxID=545276 RepID=UPI00036971D6|nr:TIGR02281 family clan AA aspartic protease [Thioalkalivibrio sp. ALJ24]